jgi:replicative DNA helicase
MRFRVGSFEEGAAMDGENGVMSKSRGGRERNGTFRPALDVSRLFDQAPPQSEPAEAALLGSIILDHSVLAEVLLHVPSGSAFYSERHGAVYDALLQQWDAHQSGDLVQLHAALEEKGLLEDIGGREYLVRLAEAVPSAANAVHYARIVAEKARLRRLIDAAGQILYDAFHTGELGPEGVRETIDKAERLIFDVAEDASTKTAESLKELLHETFEILDANDGRAITGLSSGYFALDELTAGFQAGEMIIIAARPSMGKTALALNLAEQIALGGGPSGGRSPVAFFSLEMSRQTVAQRLLCAHSGVDANKLRRNQLSEDDYERLMRSSGVLSEAPLYIDDTPGMTIMQLRARARRLAAQHGARCIVVDYLQLLTAPGAGRESRQVEVSTISRGIKALARELNVPVICLSQLNRGAEQREGHRPRMSDLRESGSIEQDADVICLLHREEYYHIQNPEWIEENPDKRGLAELILAKQRNGPTGTVELTWDNRVTRFRNHEGFGGSAGLRTQPSAASEAPAFAPGKRSGPEEGFRDGGGPEADFDDGDTGGAPF